MRKHSLSWASGGASLLLAGASSAQTGLEMRGELDSGREKHEVHVQENYSLLWPPWEASICSLRVLQVHGQVSFTARGGGHCEQNVHLQQ